MDLLNRTDIQTLAASGGDGMHVSLFIPTHRYGGEVQGDQLQWKNLVSAVDALLTDEMRRSELDALLAPARELQNDSMAWQHMSDGLAMFLSPQGHHTYRIPASLPLLATAGGPLRHRTADAAPLG